MPTPYRVDALIFGKKLRVRTEGPKYALVPTRYETYTIEKREDGLYVSGFGYPDFIRKVRSVESYPPHHWKERKQNFVAIGMTLAVRVDDPICGEGGQVIERGKVVEITEES